MPRLTREQIDDEIVDHAAELFARHGYRDTSVQRIADAAGYSKTGLLHRFPSKEALRDAVLARWSDGVRLISEGVAHLPAGPARDEALVTALVDAALPRPGAIAFLLGTLAGDDGELDDRVDAMTEQIFAAFGAADADAGRLVRIGAALSGIAVVALGAARKGAPDGVREHLIAAGYDALGHRVPGHRED